jgi:hypothetical protein
MAILGYEIKKGSAFSDMKTEVTNIRKALKDYQMMRPDAEQYRHPSDFDGVKIPVYYDGYHDYHRLDRLFNESDILRTIINALIRKIFRRGIEKVPLVENPSEQESDIMDKMLHRINENDQTLKDMLKMFEQNIDVTDDSYLVMAKSYSFMNGEIIGSTPKEIFSAHPAYMRIIADSEGRKGYNDSGEKVYVDPTDRYQIITETEAKSKGFQNSEGIKLVPTHYRGELGKDYGANSMNDSLSKYIYYIEGEVIHQSRWNPSLLYGYSNIHACWMKIVTLLGQDRYFLLNYTKGRPPRALLTVGTTNFASAKKSWENLMEESAKNPHGIHPLLIENKDGKNPVQFIDFLKSPQEMQLIEFRNEDRRAIASMWGIMPIFQGDVQTSGGLNNETFQVDVTNIAVDDAQEMYNDKVFPWITKNWGINDWAFKLREPEEDDEMEEASKVGVLIDNATKMSSMGFEVTWDEKLKEFSFSEVATNPELINEPFVPFTNKILDLADGRNLNKILNKVKKYSEISKQEIMKQGVVFDVKKELDPALLSLIAKDIFDKVYENQTRAMSNKINNIILDGMSSKKSITVISKEIQGLGVKKGQADLIARTENAVLKNNIREFNFTKAEGSENFLFKWLGPSDSRTAGVSKEIKKKSTKGLKLEALKTLVRKMSIKHGFKPDRDWFSHFNQRHSFVKLA